MFKKISPGDWALILGTAGGFSVTMVGAIFWISNLDAKVVGLAQAQISGRAERIQHEEEVFSEIRSLNERTGRIEGKIDILLDHQSK